MEHETGVFDVVAAVSEVEAVMLPNVDTLEDNMARLDLTEPTREAIRAAALEGRIEERDGAEVLLVEGRALDRTPMDPRWTNIPSEEGVVVVFGIGVGNTVRALREQFDGAVAIYEPNPGIARTLLEQGPHGLGDVDLFTSLHELEQTWPRISGATSSATIVRVVGYPELYPKENAELHSMVEQLVARSSVNVSTYRQRARTWVSDLLDNIELLADAPRSWPWRASSRAFPRSSWVQGPPWPRTRTCSTRRGEKAWSSPSTAAHRRCLAAGSSRRSWPASSRSTSRICSATCPSCRG